jgi:hypothetical protein
MALVIEKILDLELVKMFDSKMNLRAEFFNKLIQIARIPKTTLPTYNSIAFFGSLQNVWATSTSRN